MMFATRIFLGLAISITLELDLQPRFLALLPAKLESIEFRPVEQPVPAGTDLVITGTVALQSGCRAGCALTGSASACP